MLITYSIALVTLVAAPAQTQLKPVTARSEARAADSTVFSGRRGRLDVVVPRFENPDIRIDGRLEEEIWERAARLTDFTQYEPVEGIPATEDTEVYVFYSTDAIYFGIRALDARPDLIVSRLGERDRAVFGDDWVRLMIDTFDDQRQAYVFYVNPLGIQTDGLWIEGMQNRRGFGGGGISIDFNPDFIWDSDGRVNETGWAAEIRIPYVSLRFRETPVQQWGFQVAREVKRRGFKQAWAPLTTNVSSTLAQSGHLVGLENLRARRLVEIRPEVTGQRIGDDASGQFARGDFDPDFGMNGRVGVTQNLVLDGTINPDFSQVEADANRLTVNERFAIFFAEKRPFFLEGSEIFQTPRNLVHTRQIVDPSGGAKLTGKVGSFNVGYLGALDESPRTFGGNPNASRAAFNMLRIRRDVGQGSTMGFLYTDRSLTDGGAFNRVAAADARFLIGGRYTVTAQLAGAWTGDSLSAPARFKPLGYLSVAKSGRTFSWNAHFEDVHPDFRTNSGFINRVGDVNTQGGVSFTKFGRPGAVIERFSVRVNADAFFKHDEFWDGGTPFEAEVQAFPTLSFKGDRSITFVLRDGYFRFEPQDYADFGVQDAQGNAQPFVVPGALSHMKAFGLLPRARITNEVQLNGRLFLREVPIFLEAGRGFEVQAAPDLTVRPTASLQVSLSQTFLKIWREDNTVFSTVHLSRLRTQYQFSKSLFVRALVQYELEQRSALQDPTSGRPLLIGGSPVAARDQGEFQGQFLAQYQPSPGTVFFVGYTRLMEGERTYRLSRMSPTADGLFVKLSYLFRM